MRSFLQHEILPTHQKYTEHSPLRLIMAVMHTSICRFLSYSTIIDFSLHRFCLFHVYHANLRLHSQHRKYWLFLRLSCSSHLSENANVQVVKRARFPGWFLHRPTDGSTWQNEFGVSASSLTVGVCYAARLASVKFFSTML